MVGFGIGSSIGCQPEATSEQQETELKNLIAQWHAQPRQEHLLNTIADQCEQALEVSNRDRDFDLLLADTVSNILLRPDLGLPLYTQYAMTLSPQERDSYRNALLRSQALKELRRT